MHTSKHRLAVLMSAMLALMIPFSAIQAASPHAVDPDSLLPALNPLYAPYDCWEAGGGITCRGEVENTYGPEVLDFFDCGGTAVYVSGAERQTITRWHDAGGNATTTILDTEFRDVFSIDPSGSGPSVSMFSRFTKHYDYLVPGVRDSRVMRQTGASLIARASDGAGVLARETGWIEFEPGVKRISRPFRTCAARRTSSRTSTASSTGSAGTSSWSRARLLHGHDGPEATSPPGFRCCEHHARRLRSACPARPTRRRSRPHPSAGTPWWLAHARR